MISCILFSQEQKQSLATQLNWLCHSLLQALVEVGNYLWWVGIVLLSLHTFKQRGNSLTDIFALAYCRRFWIVEIDFGSDNDTAQTNAVGSFAEMKIVSVIFPLFSLHPPHYLTNPWLGCWLYEDCYWNDNWLWVFSLSTHSFPFSLPSHQHIG